MSHTTALEPQTDDAVARLLAAAPAADAIDLSIGEPDQKLPPALAQIGAESLAAGQTGYTTKPGMRELRELLVADVAASTGYTPSADDVTVTVGGSEAVALAIMAVCTRGDSIVIPDPAWPNYRLLADGLGVEVIRYPQGASGDDFFDLDAITAGLERGARLVVVNSPSNPTGAVASAAALARLVELVRAHDAYLLSDEAYESIVFAGGRAPSPLTTGGDVTLCARTFSKTFSMTGMRVGSLVSPPQLSTTIGALHGVVTGCASITSQVMAIAALQAHGGRGAELSEEYAERFRIAHEILGDWLAPAPVESLGGFYLWVDGGRSGFTSAELVALLRERGIVVSSGRVYTEAEGFVRLALTLDRHSLVTVLTQLRDLLTAGS